MKILATSHITWRAFGSQRTQSIYLDGSEILSGYFPVLLALQSSFRQIHKVFITNQKLSERQRRITQLASDKGIQVQRVESNVLETLTQRHDKERGVHQGVCADVSRIPIKRISNYSERDGPPGTDVFLCGIRDPFNVGSILRSSYYLGIQDVFISEEYKSARMSPIVSKASSGTLEIHPPKHLDDPVSYLHECLASRGRVIGLDSHEGQRPRELDLHANSHKILLLGSEDTGIPKELSSLCSDWLRIPPGRTLNPDVDSLNVSTASAILMHELLNDT